MTDYLKIAIIEEEGVLPTTDIVFYCDDRGRAPVLEWLNEVRKSDPKGWAKCVARIEDLADLGHTLDRPRAALLQNGLYELRARHVSAQYRILYFFHKRQMGPFQERCENPSR